ncbi:hypothetical protein KEM52_005359 [Ascosphaera acerosa]|nr:hypothetical protein KEM52_005359 [Ascosphaera acerosa]
MRSPYRLRRARSTTSSSPEPPGASRQQEGSGAARARGLDAKERLHSGSPGRAEEEAEFDAAWCSDDDQLLGLLADDLERQAREEALREQHRSHDSRGPLDGAQLGRTATAVPQRLPARHFSTTLQTHALQGATESGYLCSPFPPGSARFSRSTSNKSDTSTSRCDTAIGARTQTTREFKSLDAVRDIEDYYVRPDIYQASAGTTVEEQPRSANTAAKCTPSTGGATRVCPSLGFNREWARSKVEESVSTQVGEGEGRSGAVTAAVPELGTGRLRAFDAPGSPEGRTRDRERDHAISQQQISKFASISDENLPSATPASVHEAELQSRNSQGLLGPQAQAGLSNDPVTSLSAPVDLRDRSPLQLFRSRPRKTLSVTDLVSTSWCELQYWYTLAYHGRKPTTAAMKLGTEAHKTLEDQVHTTVPVEVLTREDGWALRIWNLIQGLRTLRATGLTREFEVWGIVDGELVVGIIDQIARQCPDEQLEKEVEGSYPEISTRLIEVAQKQSMSLDEFFMQNAGGQPLSVFEAMMGKRVDSPSNPDAEQPSEPSDATQTGRRRRRCKKRNEPRYYITDIKTRGGRSSAIPSPSSSGFRPTGLQLQLYYHMLTRLITTDDVTIDKIAERHRLDIDLPFSDSFIAQVSEIQQPDFRPSTSSSSDSAASSAAKKRRSKRSSAAGEPRSGSHGEQLHAALDSGDILEVMLQHNTLRSLWPLMKEQLRLTFLPDSTRAGRRRKQSDAPTFGGRQPSPPAAAAGANGDHTLISPLVTATYISPHDPDNPAAPLRLLGSRSFVFSPSSLYTYLNSAMRWWRGYRETYGVPVYEAWKCGFCEFRDVCSWRRDKEAELARKAEQKLAVRKAAADPERQQEAVDVLDDEVKAAGVEPPEGVKGPKEDV